MRSLVACSCLCHLLLAPASMLWMQLFSQSSWTVCPNVSSQHIYITSIFTFSGFIVHEPSASFSKPCLSVEEPITSTLCRVHTDTTLGGFWHGIGSPALLLASSGDMCFCVGQNQQLKWPQLRRSLHPLSAHFQIPNCQAIRDASDSRTCKLSAGP